jgi:PAS domain S-box-containing protein
MNQAPRQTEERYRLLVEGQSELLCQFEPEGTVLFVNGAYARACGATREGLIGRNFWEFIPQEDRARVRTMLDRLTPERPELQIENRFQTTSGPRWILWTNRGLRFSPDGRLLEAQSTGIDITDRKQAEEALRESEARFRAMADAAPILIWLSGVDGLCTWFNKPWLDFTGRRMDQEIGEGWLENVHDEDAPSFLNTFKTAFGQRKPFSTEYRLRRHDGEYRWLLDQGVPLNRPNGEFAGYVGSCVDITERKQGEKALRHLAEIVASSDDAIVSKDLNGIIMTWNKGAERIFGYSAEEIIGKSIQVIIPPELLQEEQRILETIRRGERMEHIETRRRRKDGVALEVSLTISPIKDANGKIVGISKVARDITERKRAERHQKALYELVASVNRSAALSDVFAAALEAICVCQQTERASVLLRDADGVMRFRAWRGLSDDYRRSVEGHSPWSPEDLHPQPVCVNDVAQANIPEALRSVVLNEGIRALAFIPLAYEGRLLGKFMLYYNRPHAFSQEEIQVVQTIASQVVFAIERQLSGAALEHLVYQRTASLYEAIAQMEEFSYSVSHDLRSPVRAMQGYAKAILEDYSERLGPEATGYLERIIQSSRRMERLIHDVLTYSRVNRQEIRIQPVPLGRLIGELIRQYPELDPSRADIRVDPSLPSVLGHEPLLGQAIANLLNNAVKFVRPGVRPQVDVMARCQNNRVTLCIADNGVGIAPEHQRRLFGMFERLHPESTYEGTGIGLAIVRRVVERMGGDVGVESDGAHGSTFWIRLPEAKGA